MSRNRTTFRQRDLSAALKSVARAGHIVERVELGQDGRIILILAPPVVGGAVSEPEPNEWDEVFDDANPAQICERVP
jgi:hypothetical protein